MKMRRMFLAPSLAFLFLPFFISCGNKTAEEETFAEEDTIEEPAMFPDTAYASVDDLLYTVEILDTTVSGELQFTHSEYLDSVSHLTFRKNNLRNADFGGRIVGTPTKIVVDWTFDTGQGGATRLGAWGGSTGWTGQPLYVHWPDSVFEEMKKAPGVTENFGQTEVIFASLCGQIFFLNPENGKESRKPLDAGAVIKGTPSLDPSFNGNLYVGQGVAFEGKRMGSAAFNLFTMEQFFIMDYDPKARRNWNAFDSSAMCAGGFLFWPGENGTLYKYIRESSQSSIKNHQSSIKLHSTLRYNVKGMPAAGMESSMAVYSNYGYTADSHGNILCINLNTMKPVWRYNNMDDNDSSPVLEIEDGKPYVYVGCEVDKRGDGATARFAKIDGLTGREVWCAEEVCQRWHCAGNKIIDGGIFGTPLVGKGNCADIVYTNPCKHGKEAGVVLALDKKTGRELFRTQLKHYAWSSMVPFYNERDELFIFLGDCIGNVYLINGKNGEIIYTEKVGNNFESSPVAFGNSCIVGSRGTTIYRFSIK